MHILFQLKTSLCVNQFVQLFQLLSKCLDQQQGPENLNLNPVFGGKKQAAKTLLNFKRDFTEERRKKQVLRSCFSLSKFMLNKQTAQ